MKKAYQLLGALPIADQQTFFLIFLHELYMSLSYSMKKVLFNDFRIIFIVSHHANSCICWSKYTTFKGVLITFLGSGVPPSLEKYEKFLPTYMVRVQPEIGARESLNATRPVCNRFQNLWNRSSLVHPIFRETFFREKGMVELGQG